MTCRFTNSVNLVDNRTKQLSLANSKTVLGVVDEEEKQNGAQ